MKITPLTKETNEIQRVLALRSSRNHRYRYQEFIIERRIAIDEAIERRWKIKALFYNKDRQLSSWAQQHLACLPCDVAYAVSGPLMNKISDKSDSAEMIAIGETQVRDFASYQPLASDVVVVLDEPKSPGNVGMIIRSACAFGARAVLISGHGADEYDPQCVRSSVGTFFSIPIYRVSGVKEFAKKIENLKSNRRVKVIASGNRGDYSIEQADFKTDLLFLVLGNETTGVSSGYRHLADQFVQIRLAGKFTSLNIAAAGSIFLYAIFRENPSNNTV